MANFDRELIEKALENTQYNRVEFIKRLAFIFGCFILPKSMMKSFTAEIPIQDFKKQVLPE
jgi:hypothetical protein